MKKVVLFGDSLTDYFPMEKLDQREFTYINAGREGETLAEMKARVGEDVIAQNPDIVLIQGGANDYLSPLYQGAEVVASRLANLGLSIAERLPNAKVYVESLYPVYPRRMPGDIYSWAEGKSNAEIQKINQLVKVACGESSPIFVNIYAHLANNCGELSLDDTKDGVHLSESGYEKVLKAVHETLYL